MPTVTNTIKYPNLTLTAGQVTIDLVGENGRPITSGAFVSASDYAIESSYSAPLASSAPSWSVTLVANSLINPAGTAYRVQESVNGSVTTYYIDVPNGGGPYVAEDVLVDPPAAIASSALSSHLTDAADAHDASAVSYAGSSNLVATDVEAALDELDLEKASLSQIVLDFADGSTQHVNHGPFWPTGSDLGNFLWEAWIMPRAGAEYWVSEGYGGNHALLAGFGGGATPTMTGNVWDGSSLTSFAGAYNWNPGEWGVYAVGWDGTYIWCFMNGVPVGRTAFSGPRRAEQGVVYIGGSDHSNFFGRLAQVRAFEGAFPLTGTSAYRPERPFGNVTSDGTVASLLADYTKPGLVVPDASRGYNGGVHPGAPFSSSRNNGIPQGVGVWGYPYPRYVVDTSSPFDWSQLVLPSESIPAPTSVPVGAKIHDSFGRRNQTYAFQVTPTLGTTEGGSLGAKTWHQGTLVNPATDATTGYWLLLQGAAVPVANYPIAWVTSDSADMDVQVKRQAPTAGMKCYAGLAFRVQDAGNCWILACEFAGGAEKWLLAKYTAGSLSVVAEDAVANDGTTMRVTTSGNTITVYKSNGAGWTQVRQVTDAHLNTATGAGLCEYGSQDATGRILEFTVS